MGSETKMSRNRCIVSLSLSREAVIPLVSNATLLQFLIDQGLFPTWYRYGS